MAEPLQPDVPSGDALPGREPDRAADHDAIDRLAEELLPALIAKLSATGLGELEVRQGGWRVRLRRPADAASRERRPHAGPRSQPGHAGHGHGPVPVEGHRPARPAVAATNGASPGAHTAVGPGRPDGHDRSGPAYATSPAVGVFRVASGLSAGNRVRAGDRLGAVDMLGVAQEVVAPCDGIVGEQVVESGDAVEYGQELIAIEFAAAPSAHGES